MLKKIVSQTSTSVNVNFPQPTSSRRSVSPVSLRGKFFLSYHRNGVVRWQGQILAEVSPGRYRIQLYEWLTRSPSDQLVVSARSMRRWTFYDSADAWHADIERRTGARRLDDDADSSTHIFVFTPSITKGATCDN